MGATPCDLQLGFSIGTSADWVTARALLDGLRAGERWDVAADRTVISLVANGREHLAGLVSWGPAARLSAQFEPAARRLAASELALVRSAWMDIVNGITLLLVPDGAEVEIGVAATDQLPWAGWFPDDPAHGDELYGYVIANRADMEARGRDLGFHSVRADRTSIASALRREHDLAGEVLAILDG